MPNWRNSDQGPLEQGKNSSSQNVKKNTQAAVPSKEQTQKQNIKQPPTPDKKIKNTLKRSKDLHGSLFCHKNNKKKNFQKLLVFKDSRDQGELCSKVI